MASPFSPWPRKWASQRRTVSDSIIHAWRAADKKTKGGEKSTSTLEEEVESLRRQLRQTELDRMAEATRYFKKSCRHFQPNDLRLIYQFIKQEEPHFAVRMLCNTLEVSKSSYYEYRAGITFQPSITEQQMTTNVEEVFWENRRRYGSRRVQKALQEQGIEVGRHQVRRLMKIQNWQAIQPRSFVPRTTDSRHGLQACPNLLLALGQPTRPDQAWVSDITYLPLVGGGWVYLASWLDLFSRRIVGWHVDITMEEGLIIRAFDQATTLRRPQSGLIAHSDQGGQYFGKTFRRRLNKWQCRQSMAEKENPYQNAHAESLWSRLKAELLEDAGPPVRLL